MLVLEVLVGELLAVDGATTGALFRTVRLDNALEHLHESSDGKTYVVAGEVTTLQHELRDDAVEARATVALALGLLAKLTEVLGGLGDISLVEVEVDGASLG